MEGSISRASNWAHSAVPGGLIALQTFMVPTSCHMIILRSADAWNGANGELMSRTLSVATALNDLGIVLNDLSVWAQS